MDWTHRYRRHRSPTPILETRNIVTLGGLVWKLSKLQTAPPHMLRHQIYDVMLICTVHTSFNMATCTFTNDTVLGEDLDVILELLENDFLQEEIEIEEAFEHAIDEVK